MTNNKGCMEPERVFEQYRDLKISKQQLSEKLHNDPHKVVIDNPIIVTSLNVIKCLTSYLSLEIDKQAMIDWVNIIWFNDAYEFEESETDSIVSVVSVIETMDEDGVVVTDDDIRKMIGCLSLNEEYEN